MLNKVILMGRLTKEPILEVTPAGVPIAKFTLAVDRNYVKQGEERSADFIQCVAWRGTAEFINKYFGKGQLIALVGNIQTRSWYDDEGKRHYVTEVTADEVYFAGGKINTTEAADNKYVQSTHPGTESPSMDYFRERGFVPEYELNKDADNGSD